MPFKSEEEGKEYRRKYYREHKSQRADYAHKYTLSHKEEKREYDQMRRKKLSAELKQYGKLYRINNRDKILKQGKEWRKKHRDTKAIRMKKSNYDLKIKVLSHYSNGYMCCAFCGYSNPVALSIDHVEGDGAKHRRELRAAHTHLYQWLVNSNFPKGFQVLCMNCQYVKRHFRNETCGQRKKLPVSKLDIFLNVKKQGTLAMNGVQ